MATNASDRDSPPPLPAPCALDEDSKHAAKKTLSSSGGSRQTRRLQLRNAGFRGAAVPPRKITPKSIPSGNWTATPGMNAMSDIENLSPTGTRASPPPHETRTSSGVLQEIGNSTITHRPKKARRRIGSKAFEPDVPADDEMDSSRPASPPQPRASVRRQSLKSKPKVSHRRRSASAETTRYIEHLEAELSAAQSQLSSVTSSSVTREHSSKMRTLNAETRHLQEELADWEAKYEHRVREELDRHLTVETDLKARIRNLENDADEAKFRIEYLESQLQTSGQEMQAVEMANVSLEKRLEMMTELLAGTKVDLHVETPGRARRHVRPKSMLPRFPTASSLMGSPERQPRTQPASPLSSYTNCPIDLPDSPSGGILALDSSADNTDFMSEADSIFSEHSTTAHSMTSAGYSDNQSSFNPWNLPPRQNIATKPARRMRRFGAGSLGPKPLILPSASQSDYFPPASAPPLEHSRGKSVFFPSGWKVTAGGIESPVAARRRASTISFEADPIHHTPSPFRDIPEQCVVDDHIACFSPSPSAQSYNTIMRHSSLGSVPGRNLLEELNAARSVTTTESFDQPTEERKDTSTLPEDINGCSSETADDSMPHEAIELSGDLIPLPSSIIPSHLSTTRPPIHRSRSREMMTPHGHSQSMLARLRTLFGDLWRSPITVARYLIEAAQARMRVPRPLINVQWWLVGVLLGPMARRRMLSSTKCCSDGDERLLLVEDTPERSPSGALLTYGSIRGRSPTSSPRSLLDVGGNGKKRACSNMCCVHHRAKHSPWLWIKFSITLAFAIGAAFKDGPGSLLKASMCRCSRKGGSVGTDSDDQTLLAC